MKQCNICSAPTEHKTNEILFADGAKDLEEYDWCLFCKHVVRGSVKRIKGKLCGFRKECKARF